MVVSLNGLGFRRTPMQTPEYYSPYYGEHPKKYPNFGRPLQSRIGELRKLRPKKQHARLSLLAFLDFRV